MTGNAGPSFADWQFSRGIVPWVVVQDFSEYDHRVYEMKARCGFVVRRNVEPVVEAFKAMAAAVTSIADYFAQLGESTAAALRGQG